MSTIKRVFIKSQDQFRSAYDVETYSVLPPGVYQASYDQRHDVVTYKENHSVHDGIIDLPTPEYTELINDVDVFFSEDSKARFKQMNYTHKYNILLWGKPGTGKSILTKRVTNKVISLGGVALVNPDISNLLKILEPLNSIQPDTSILVILEEFEEEARRYERALLNLLDGPHQMKNVMYIATTNYLDKVPRRMVRPGRFSNTLEIKLPDENARRFYLQQKFTDEVIIEDIVSATKDFTIDEVKEVVKQYYCLGKNLKHVSDLISKNPSRFLDESDDEDEDDDF